MYNRMLDTRIYKEPSDSTRVEALKNLEGAVLFLQKAFQFLLSEVK